MAICETTFVRPASQSQLLPSIEAVRSGTMIPNFCTNLVQRNSNGSLQVVRLGTYSSLINEWCGSATRGYPRYLDYQYFHTS